MSSEGVRENLRLMRHLARRVEEGRTPGARVSYCHLNKHCLINSLWAKVSERSEGVFLRRYPSAFLNHQNFANTIGKPSRPWVCLPALVATTSSPTIR